MRLHEVQEMRTINYRPTQEPQPYEALFFRLTIKDHRDLRGE